MRHEQEDTIQALRTGCVTTSQVAKRLGIDARTARRRLDRMAKRTPPLAERTSEAGARLSTWRAL